MNDYLEFLERKKHSIGNYGIEPNYLPSSLFDYQNYVAEYAIKKGRCAVFLDTGLGKTLIELVIAANMGVGSEVYSPVSLGRKAIGIELKDSYFKQAIENMKHTSERFKDNQLTLL